jgi:hypothetical protein
MDISDGMDMSDEDKGAVQDLFKKICNTADELKKMEDENAVKNHHATCEFNKLEISQKLKDKYENGDVMSQNRSHFLGMIHESLDDNRKEELKAWENCDKKKSDPEEYKRLRLANGAIDAYCRRIWYQFVTSIFHEW